MSDISLTTGIRANLLSLQRTTSLIEETQFKLSTGRKVNSVLDDPVSFFKSQGLSFRASDLSARKDGIVQGLQTIQAATTGIDGILDLVKSAQAKATQAKELDLTHAYALTATVTQAIASGNFDNTAWFDDNGFTQVALTSSENRDVFLENFGSYELKISSDTAGTATFMTFILSGNEKSISGIVTYQQVADALGKTDAISTTDDMAEFTVDDVLSALSAEVEYLTFEYDAAGEGIKIYSSDSDVVLKSLSSAALSGGGIALEQITGLLPGGTFEEEDLTDELRQLSNDYNAILDQIDSLAQDASYQGVNLLNDSALSNKLTVYFNEDLSEDSKLDVQGVDVTSSGLSLYKADWVNTTTDGIDKSISQTNDAQAELRQASGSFGTSASVLNIRNEFTESLVNTLKTGSGELVNADANEESANMLALQTRQQLGTISLSIANQSEQSILRLF